MVGCQASKADAVQLAILERCALCFVAHFTPDNAVQRLLTPHHLSLGCGEVLAEGFHSPILKGPDQY